MIAARPITPDSGKPPARLLATQIRSGCTAIVLHGEHLAGTAETGLDLVGDQHDAVLVADAAQPCINSAGAMWKPPSPCTGSMMIAATRAGSMSALKQEFEIFQRLLGGDAELRDRERQCQISACAGPKPFL